MDEILDALGGEALKRLCEINGLRVSGRDDERRRRVAAHYGGDIARLVDDLRVTDLKAALRPDQEAEIGTYFFSALSNASQAELHRLAVLVFVEGWEPSKDAEAPLGGRSPIKATLYESDEPEDDDEAEDGDEDEAANQRVSPGRGDASDVLRAMLSQFQAQALVDMLDDADLPTSGAHGVRVGRLKDALLAGDADFGDNVLSWAYKDELSALCKLAGIDAGGLREELWEGLVEWFDDRFPEVPGDHDHGDDEELEEDSGTPDDDSLSFEFDPVEAAKQPYPFQREVVAALVARTTPPKPGRQLLIRIATGGGKTRVANDWIWNHVLPERRRVLWLTKDWELLRQASSDLCRRFTGARERLGRVGGDQHLSQLRDNKDAAVVYTTIHTWVARRNTEFRTSKFDYIIIDEVHWGEGRPSYRKLEQRYQGASAFIGLTATPRSWSNYEAVCKGLDFPDLVRMEILARPHKPVVVETRERWTPERRGEYGDFSASSLAALARSAKRNQRIVSTYAADPHKFGKTLVFACDVNHAIELTALFRGEGFSAEVLHHEMKPQERRAVVARFRRGAAEGRSRIDVLINVAMMTHGVDVPDIETVFLARPTASDTLFSQMVGRAARRTEYKTRFWVVDFVDNLSAHGDVLVSSGKYFGADLCQASPEITQARNSRGPQLRRHAFQAAEILYYPGKPGYEALKGLEFQPGQTFGVEFEFTRDDFEPHTKPRDWLSVAKSLLAVLKIVPSASNPRPEHSSGDKDDSVWNVEWDGSCGWEVTSRILQGEAGIEELHDACAALTEALGPLGLKVNFRTGTHVHLGWQFNHEHLRRLMNLVAHFEPAVMSLVSPSRASNQYCEPIRKHIRRFRNFRGEDEWGQHFEDPEARYLAVNPANLFGGLGTVEIRLHNGTHEGPKILAWMSLWMRMVYAADRFSQIPETATSVHDLPLCLGEAGDIVALAKFLRTGRDLEGLLAARRRAVVTNSWLNHEEFGALARRVLASWTT